MQITECKELQISLNHNLFAMEHNIFRNCTILEGQNVIILKLTAATLLKKISQLHVFHCETSLLLTPV